jgi:hypothetical protein
MLFASLALLLLIPHNEPRYAMGLLPALAVLAGGAFSLLPSRWWLRAPVVAVLCLGLAWNYALVSFREPIFAQSSGSFRSPPSPHCLAEGRALVRRILETAAALAADDRPAALASHPLNRHTLIFNQDLYPLMIWQEKRGVGSPFSVTICPSSLPLPNIYRISTCWWSPTMSGPIAGTCGLADGGLGRF